VVVGRARVSFWEEIEQRKKKWRLGFVQGMLYCAGARLVTPSSKEESPALRRRGARRRAVLHAHEEDEDDLLSVISGEGVSWAKLGCAGLVLMGCWWTVVLGCSAR
jgi:hypothetical protein